MSSTDLLPDAVAANLNAAQTVYERCRALADLSELTGKIQRTYLTPQHSAANKMVQQWMTEAKLTPHIDPAGSIVGESRPDCATTLVLGLVLLLAVMLRNAP